MRPRPIVVAIVLLVSWTVACTLAVAQIAPPRRVEISVAAGVFIPAQSDVRALYPRTKVPIVVVGDVRVSSLVSVFAGGRLLKTSGYPTDITTGAPIASELELTLRSFMAGVRVHYRMKTLGIFAGIGASHTSYTESWRDTGESFSRGVWGPTVHGGASVNLHRRLAVIGRIDWSKANTGQGSLRAPRVDLGGFDVLGGIAVRF